MEDYNEKLNYGSEKEPLFRERLWVSKNAYGFNLFDRKTKKQILVNKSKETCEEAKNLLTAGKENLFNAFKERVKDEEIVTNKILICGDKYSNDIYSVPTVRDLHKVALHILEYRFENGYFQKSTLPKPLDYTKEDIEKMPESFRKDVTEKLKSNERYIQSAKEVNREYEYAETAIKENDGQTAWEIIRTRNNEYEKVELIEPKTI
jgi:hypothetical protein